MVYMKTTQKKPTKPTIRKKPDLHQLMIKDELWEAVKPILQAIGTTRSTFVSLIFKSLIDSGSKPFAEVQGYLFEELMRVALKRKKLKE